MYSKWKTVTKSKEVKIDINMYKTYVYNGAFVDMLKKYGRYTHAHTHTGSHDIHKTIFKQNSMKKLP